MPNGADVGGGLPVTDGWGARGKSYEHLIPLVDAMVAAGNPVSKGFGDNKNGHAIQMRDQLDGTVLDRVNLLHRDEIRYWPQDDTIVCYHCGTTVYGGLVRELVRQLPMAQRIRELGAEGKAYAHLVPIADWLIRQGNPAVGPFRDENGLATLRMRDPLDPAAVASILPKRHPTIHYDGASRITCSDCHGEIRGGP